MSERVSVIIPTHDRDEALRRALESALRQQPAPLEVIVVDDLGRSDTQKLVVDLADQHQAGGPTLRYLDVSASPVKGPSVSRNRGASMATGDLLAFLDDDDRWLPGYLDSALATLQADPQRCCVVTWTYRVDGDRRFRGSRMDPTVDLRGPARLWAFGVVGSNLVVDAEVFSEVGGYDERLWSREDHELFVRLVDGGRGYGLVTEELVEQEAGGQGHLAGKSLRAAAGVPIYLARHGAEMTRSQRRSAWRHYHAMSSGSDNTRLRRLYHRLMQAFYSGRRDWKQMTIGRITGNRPAPLR